MNRPAVLVIRRDDRFSSILRQLGFETLNLELTRTEPLDDQTGLRERISRLADYDGLFVTSPAAAEVFVKELRSAGQSYNGKIYVLGARAAAVFENAGLAVDHRDGANTADELIDQIGIEELARKRFLYVCGNKSMRTIPQRLCGAAIVDEISVYATHDLQPSSSVIDLIRERLRMGTIGWLCFFAPTGVDGFRKYFENKDINGAKAAVIGLTTRHKAEQSGISVAYVSKRANADEFAMGLAEYIKSIE